MFDINIYIENESDIYNSFDKNHLHVSEDLRAYISDRLKERPIGEKVRFVFSSPNTIDKEQVKKAFDQFMEELANRLEKERKQSLFQCLRLLLIGVLFVVIGVISEPYTNTVIAAIISTIGSFSIWEAANRWLIELPNIKVMNRMASFLKVYELEIKQEKSI